MTKYTITRKKASNLLNVSTRSIDRYIKSGKLRAKKKWKVVHINEEDINKLSCKWAKNQEIIVPNKEKKKKEIKTENTVLIKDLNKSDNSIETIFNGLRKEIEKKDETIKELAIKLGRAEEIARNSISLIEFKKSQFLLEESKWYLSKEVEDLRKYRKFLKKRLNYEKKTNYILIVFTIILFVSMIVIWFSKI